jgi:hypothetical protein
MPVILATQKAAIRRIEVGSHPGQNSFRDPILNKPITKKGGAGGVAKGVGPEFKRQYHKNKQNLPHTSYLSLPSTGIKVKHHYVQLISICSFCLFASFSPQYSQYLSLIKEKEKPL